MSSEAALITRSTYWSEFGDSVTLSVWRDIWLAEGFARFSEWMYNERTGGQTAQGIALDYGHRS